MGLALEVEKIEVIPEAQRAWYVEDATTKKFKLDPAKVEIEDTTGLKSALQKEKDAARVSAKAIKDMQEKYEGIDPEQVKSLMAKFNSKEEAELIAAGKMDQVIELRTEKQRVAQQKLIDAANAHAKAADERAAKFSQRVLDNHIRAAAAKAGLHAHAIEDALFRARVMFSLNESGDAVQLGADGHPVLGKDGKTAFSPAEWLESMKETAPHWFPAGASGGGAGNDKGAGGAGSKTITRDQFDALSPQEKAKSNKDGVKVIE